MHLPEWLLESWIEWAIAMVVVAVRVISRTTVFGFRQWQGDDYLIILAAICFTVSVVSDHYFFEYGNNHTVTEEALRSMTVAEKQRIRVGSIWDFVGWITYATLIWCCKGCMLFLYSRLTMGLYQHKLVKICAYLCVFTYIGAWLGMLLKCQPVTRNWQVEPPPGQCVKGVINLYVIGILNFTTDLLILCIPIPLVLHVHVPMRKKILIAILLLSGVFILVAIVLRVVLTLLILYGKYRGGHPYDLGFMLDWSNRENFVSMIVVNIPIIFSSINFRRHRKPSTNSSSGLRSGDLVERTHYGSQSSAVTKDDEGVITGEKASDHEVPRIPSKYQDELQAAPRSAGTTSTVQPQDLEGGRVINDIAGIW